MGLTSKAKRTRIVIRLLGLVVAALGIYALIACLFIASLPSTYRGNLPYFLLSNFRVAIGFCIFSIYIAVRIWARLSPTSIRQLCAIVAIMLWFLALPIAGLIHRLFPAIKEGTWVSLIVTLVLIPAIIIYYYGSRRLVALASLENSSGSSQKRGVSITPIVLFVLVSLSIFTIANALMRDVALDEKMPTGFWGSAVTFSPLLLAIIVYVLGVFLFYKRRRRTSSSLSEDKKNAR